MFVKDFSVEAHQFLAGERIQTTADRIDGTRNVLGASISCPFEHHMFNEVRQSALCPTFNARPGSDPYAQGYRTDRGHRLSHDPQTIRKCSSLNLPGGSSGFEYGGTGSRRHTGPSFFNWT